MKTRRILPLILLLIALLCGCRAEDPAPSPTSTPTPTPAPTPAPTPSPSPSAPAAEAEPRFLVAFDAYAETFYADDGTTALLGAAYTTPVVTVLGNEKAAAAVNAAFAEMRDRFFHAPDEYDAGVDTALADARSIREQGYQGEAFALEQTFSVPRADGAVLSFCGEFYSYLGGAHPNIVTSGVSFDAQGARVSLDDLSGDPAGFTAFCAEKVTALAEADDDGRYYENYKELIPDNIRDDMWYFDDAGLTFIYNAYDIGSYAAGSFSFTIPYAELRGVLDDRWLPPETAGGGAVSCSLGTDADAPAPLFTLERDADGAELVFTARGTVRNVQVSAAAWSGEDAYTETGILAFLSRMDDGERVLLKYLFPGDMSFLCLRYTAGDGAPVSVYPIHLSGEDGSLLTPEG